MEKSKFEINRDSLKLMGAIAATAVVAFTAGRWIEKVNIAATLLKAIV